MGQPKRMVISKKERKFRLIESTDGVLRNISPVVGLDMHGAKQKFAEDRHSWVIVEWNDTRRRQTENADLQKHNKKKDGFTKNF